MSCIRIISAVAALAVIGGSFPTVIAYPGDKPPAAEKKNVIDDYHGKKIGDDYRWLEDPANADVQKWSEGQNAYTRAILDQLPDVPVVRKRITELLSAKYVNYGGVLFQKGTIVASKFQPPKQQPFLVVLKSLNDTAGERVLLDPAVIDPTNSTTIDWYVPSHDGKLLAVSLSKSGSESGDVHVFDIASGKKMDDVVPRVNGGTAGGSLSWNGDGTGFYYTRYPRGTERPKDDMAFYTQVYFHKLGAKTEDDKYEIGKDFPKIAEIELETSEDGKQVLASVQYGDGGEYAHFVRSDDGKWNQIADYKDKVVHAALGFDGEIYLLSHAGAPRGKIQKLSGPAATLASAKTIVPEGEGTIDEFLVTPTRIFVIEQLGGPSQIKLFDHDGQPGQTVNTLPVSTAGGLTRLDGDNVLFTNVSFLVPSAIFHYNAKDSKTTRTDLYNTHPVRFDDAEVVREMATSKDGTKVPMNIVRRKGTKLDGKNPTLLYGYGGYGVNMTPGFSAVRRLWLDQGGVYVMANIRGGGEFGEAWHLAGNLTKKQNVFDDFAACMSALVERGYTSTDKLAIMGGSNGGLLMGAMLTQHPEKCKVVVSHVGIYDMLRVECSPNGEFNTTEFGTVKNKEQFDALYAYSPYHHVKDGGKYPAVLFLTGANDPRVEPWHSRKFVARLQAASPDSKVLLRTSGNTGHGSGTPLNERIEQEVDVYSFMFNELGVKFTTPAAPALN